MNRSLANLDPLDAHTLHSGGRVVLLDVREDDEWAAGHAPRALHAPLGSLSPADFRDRPTILVICRSGARSTTATRMLIDAGIGARNVTGGMRAWVAEGLPIITAAGDPGRVS